MATIATEALRVVSLTSLRQAVAELLAAELDIEFVDGKLEGPVEGKDLGCSFPVRLAEQADLIQAQDVFIGIRVFKAARTKQTSARAFDPAPLEELAELIQQALQKHQTGYGAWYQRVIEVEFDHELRMVEALVLAPRDNPAV